VRYLLVLLACGAACLSASPALAFKNIEGCDIVAFASPSSPIAIAPERWQAYAQAAASLLENPPSAAANDWRGLALSLFGLQKDLLAPDKGSKAYRDYLASDSCRVLVKLNGGSVEALLNEVGQSTSGNAMAALRHLVDAARKQMDNLDRAARFRSGQDRKLSLAAYNCFVASAIVALLPPERQQTITLADFGETVTCKDAGRTEQAVLLERPGRTAASASRR